jgi:HD superfamily phosphodiesterase
MEVIMLSCNENKLAMAMLEYDRGDSRRIVHLLKVTAYARLIAAGEELDHQTTEIILAAALTHDIGINSSAGHYQQIEGPPEADKMLTSLGCDREFIDRICWLIAHHHDYSSVSEIDHRVLVEADFLVNAEEGDLSLAAIEAAEHKMFVTQTGIRLLNLLFKSEHN